MPVHDAPPATLILHCDDAQQVYVTGNFGATGTQAVPLAQTGPDRWQTRLHLPPGEYHLRYYVARGRSLALYATEHHVVPSPWCACEACGATSPQSEPMIP